VGYRTSVRRFFQKEGGGGRKKENPSLDKGGSQRWELYSGLGRTEERGYNIFRGGRAHISLFYPRPASPEGEERRGNFSNGQIRGGKGSFVG